VESTAVLTASEPAAIRILVDALRFHRSFNVIHLAPVSKFDISPFTSSEFHRSESSRRRTARTWPASSTLRANASTNVKSYVDAGPMEIKGSNTSQLETNLHFAAVLRSKGHGILQFQEGA
jgi:hypothetical protein